MPVVKELLPVFVTEIMSEPESITDPPLLVFVPVTLIGTLRYMVVLSAKLLKSDPGIKVGTPLEFRETWSPAPIVIMEPSLVPVAAIIFMSVALKVPLVVLKLMPAPVKALSDARTDGG